MANWYDEILSPFEEDDGSYDWGKIIGAGTGAISTGMQVADLLGFDVGGGSSRQPAGYQGGIPSYTVSRQQVANTYDPERRPGSGGQRYFTDTRFDGGDTSAQATGLEALNKANIASRNRAGTQMPDVYAAREAAAAQQAAAQQAAAQQAAAQQAAAQQAAAQQPFQASVGALAEGGPIKLAAGGIAGLKEGKYLDGATDGMADKKPAVIDGEEPALLSDGEFVIPADVVSHLGNGNSDAGAKVLERMMERVRKARTGNEKQGKEINPEEFLPV
jgi:hypothetical protein